MKLRLGRFTLALSALVAISTVPVLAQSSFDIRANLSRLTFPGYRDKWQFAVLGDSRGGLGVLHAALARIDLEATKFSIFTGDLVGESTGAQWRDVKETLERSAGRVPIFPVVGNHETYGEGIGLFIEIFGNPSGNPLGPLDYSFDYGGARFVLLDNSRAGRYGPEGFSDDQLVWLERRLMSAPELRFVAAHKPPHNDKWEHAFYHNSEAFAAILEKYRVTAAFFGHIHFYDRREQGGVAYVISGGAGAPLYDWKGDPDAGNKRIFASAKGVKAHNFVLVSLHGGRVWFETYTDRAKLLELKPRRSAGIELAPGDFQIWESVELGLSTKKREPAVVH